MFPSYFFRKNYTDESYQDEGTVQIQICITNVNVYKIPKITIFTSSETMEYSNIYTTNNCIILSFNNVYEIKNVKINFDNNYCPNSTILYKVQGYNGFGKITYSKNDGRVFCITSK